MSIWLARSAMFTLCFIFLCLQIMNRFVESTASEENHNSDFRDKENYPYDSPVKPPEMLYHSDTSSSLHNKPSFIDPFSKQSLSSHVKNDDSKNEKYQKFSRVQLIDGLKSKSFKRIILLTGAGISVSAGIPDFRSDKGLYSQLGEYNLPYPEAIFHINYFRHNPEPFYKLARSLLEHKAKPTIAHYFIKMLADEGVLFIDFTQNVDGLELEVGIDPKFLVEAHGHVRSAHCSVCHKKKSIEELKRYILQGKIYRCECSGPVKPDIIFFGEQLPYSFFDNLHKISEADLVIVMGTSLRAFPFVLLAHKIPDEIPIVLINRENTVIQRENLLFLQGDIDDLVVELIKDLGWQERFESLKNK